MFALDSRDLSDLSGLSRLSASPELGRQPPALPGHRLSLQAAPAPVELSSILPEAMGHGDSMDGTSPRGLHTLIVDSGSDNDD